MRKDAEERDRLERSRFAKFLGLRQNAQLLATLTGDQLSANPMENLRASAHEALVLYAQDPRAADADWVLTDTLPRALSPAEMARLREGCYDLLLILSQAAPPAEALRILDRAVQLRPQLTASYYLRRADGLDRAGDRAGRDREVQAARALRPSTALDYLLNGRELVVRRDFDEAIRSLDRSLQLDPDQTSAQLLLAVCDLTIQPKRSREAIVSLSACIRANPGVAGLYLLRASAYGEEGNQALAKAAETGTGDPEPGHDPGRASLVEKRLGRSLAEPGRDPGRASLRASLVEKRLGRSLALPESRETAPEAARWRRAAIEAFEAAEADFGRALKLEPGDDRRYGLLTHRALLRLRADRLDEAMADLDAAIRLRPDAYQAHTTRAQVFQRQGRLDDAFAAFGRAIACRPEPLILAGLYRSRALLHATRLGISPAQQDAALHDLAESIHLEPGPVLKAGDHVWRARLLFRAIARRNPSPTATPRSSWSPSIPKPIASGSRP